MKADWKKSKGSVATKRTKKETSGIAKIKTKKSRIGVIGMGYVGLPLVMAFCKAGFKVTGFDISRDKVQMLNDGISYIRHIDLTQFHQDHAGSFTTTADFKEL